MKIGIIAFTDNGNVLLQKITASLEDTFYPYDKENEKVKDWLNDKFYSCRAIIFIGAVGIATRLIAKLIISKDVDPAVIVIDEKGKFVIPVLSGHIGGANDLSEKLAATLGAIPVITTATDIQGKFAVDVWSSTNGCLIDNVPDIKAVSAAVLKDETVGFFSDFPVAGELPEGLQFMENGDMGICVTLNPEMKPFDKTLIIIPGIITVGIGCKKNTSLEALEAFIFETLRENHISPKAVRYISSIELKMKETCLLEFAKKYCVEFTTFSKEQLNNIKGSFTASGFVKATTGVDNVCERSAVLQSGGKLIVNKTTKNGMAIAVAVSDWRCVF